MKSLYNVDIWVSDPDEKYRVSEAQLQNAVIDLEGHRGRIIAHSYKKGDDGVLVTLSHIGRQTCGCPPVRDFHADGV